MKNSSPVTRVLCTATNVFPSQRITVCHVMTTIDVSAVYAAPLGGAALDTAINLGNNQRYRHHEHQQSKR